jgi:hypothetical protein
MEYVGYANGSSNILINNRPLIQSGSNGLGSWVRYYDGTQICYNFYGTTSSAGNGGTGTVIGLPNVFKTADTYVVSAGIRGIASTGVSGSFVTEYHPHTAGTIVVKILVHTPTTIYNGGAYACTFQAVGRWY